MEKTIPVVNGGVFPIQPHEIKFERYIFPNLTKNETTNEILARIIEYSILQDKWVGVLSDAIWGSIDADVNHIHKVQSENKRKFKTNRIIKIKRILLSIFTFGIYPLVQRILKINPYLEYGTTDLPYKTVFAEMGSSEAEMEIEKAMALLVNEELIDFVSIPKPPKDFIFLTDKVISLLSNYTKDL